MQAQGNPKGLPFTAHTGMWSDAVLFSPLMATIVTSYARQWNMWNWACGIGLGVILSAIMHFGIYTKAPFQGAHARNGTLTSAGTIHFGYMAFGFAVIILFYTCTEGLPLLSVEWVSVLLVVHVIMGTLVPLKAWAKVAQPSWYPDQIKFDFATVSTIVGATVFVWCASLWASRP
jgi:hypothetical protein